MVTKISNVIMGISLCVLFLSFYLTQYPYLSEEIVSESYLADDQTQIVRQQKEIAFRIKQIDQKLVTHVQQD